MAFISFSFYKAYYLFILIWVFDFSNLKIKERLDKIYSDKDHYDLMFEFINTICFDIADLLAGFLVLYTYIRTKTKKEKQKEEEENEIKKKNSQSANSIEYIFNDLSVKNNKFPLIILVSILYYLGNSVDFYYYLIINKRRMRNGEISWLISIDILARFIFSHYLLKSKIYRHHKVSITIILLSLCSMSICAFNALDFVDSQRWPYFLFLPLKFIFIPLEDIFNKILLTEKFILPHELMFYRGIGVMIIYIILIPIYFFTNTFEFKLNELNTNEDVKLDGYIKILLGLLYILLLSFRSLSIMKVIYNFSPQHVSFINVPYYLYILLKCRSDKDDPIITIMDTICMIFILLSTLIYNEMLILKFCGLYQNTQVGFLAKEEKELKEMTSIENNDDDDENENEIVNEDDEKKKDNSEKKEEYHNI